MLTSEIINIARAHLGEGSMIGSAKIALQDAAQMFSRGLMADAKDRARQSLKYSVGILHPDYQRTLEDEKWVQCDPEQQRREYSEFI